MGSSQFMRAVFGVVLLVALLGLLATLSIPEKAEAKKPSDRKQVDKTTTPKDFGPRTVLLLLRTATSLQSDDVITTLRRGLDVSKCGITGQMTVTPASPALMGLFDKRPAWTRPAAPKCIEGITISPAQDKGNHLRFLMKDSGDNLEELVVTYRRAGNRTYIPEVDGDLQVEVAGRYLLKLENNDEPLRFTATLANNDEKRKVAQPFPAWERCYLVILPQFTGELRRLFTAVKDPAKVPNAFDDLREGPVVQMALVDLDAAEVPMGDMWDKNDYIPTVSALSKRKVKRAWVRFPLTESEATTALAAYRKLSTRQLCQVIRKEAVKADAQIKHRTVSPESKPLWFELASEEGGSRYLCRIPIKNVKGLHKKYQRLYRLLVYEFDDGTTPEAILVSDRAGGCKSAVVLQEITR